MKFTQSVRDILPRRIELLGQGSDNPNSNSSLRRVRIRRLLRKFGYILTENDLTLSEDELMKTYSPKLRERVVYSCLKPFENYDDNFVFQAPKLGVLVRTGYHKELDRQMADVYCESPSLSSPGMGDLVEISKLDGYVRSKLIELAEHCKLVGEELLENAKRLEEEAYREKLFDNLPKVDERSGNDDSDEDSDDSNTPYDEERERLQDEEVESRRRSTKGRREGRETRGVNRSSKGRGGKIDYSALKDEDEEEDEDEDNDGED